MKNGDQFNNVGFFNGAYLKYLYFSWEGRINRKKYYASILFLIPITILLVILTTILTIVAAAALAAVSPAVAAGVSFLIIAVVYAFISYMSLMPFVKRIHDLGHSAVYYIGGYALLFTYAILFRTSEGELHISMEGGSLGDTIFSILGIVLFIYGILLLILKGTNGPNKFGNDPRESSK